MSDIPTNIIKDHKRRQMSWKQTIILNYKSFKLKLKSRDPVALITSAIISLLFIIFVSISLARTTTAKTTPQIAQIDNNDLATKDLMGLDKSFHLLLNKKIMPDSSSASYEGVGFGNAAIKRLHHKPGTPPLPRNPGILNELESRESSELRQKAAAVNSKAAGRSVLSYLKFWETQPKRKLYIILGKNQETGIKNRKRREHWLMEKFSILNKKHYADKHGYELIITSSTPMTKDGKVKNLNVYQKRYQHETREGWEKFDLIRRVMREHSVNLDPENPTEIEEWYWYIDMNTFIMEPDYSIDELILDHLDSVYRDMDYFDPNNLYGEQQIKEKVDSYDDNDDSNNSIDLILTQDCKGINLNSFLIKKSDWSNMLLDVLWEPVFYRQMHLKWLSDSSGSSKYGFTLNSQEHTDYGYNNDREEKNCLEFLINTQSWIRSKIGFFPVRVFNSLSKDFCNDDEDDEISSMEDLINIDNAQQKQSVDSNTNSYLNNKLNFHYNETDRDFLVNFMMCERHGNCWDRFQQFSKINEKLHRNSFANWF